jgi:uncharacterized protein
MTDSSPFVSYDLRTTDVDAAEAFYTALLGWEVRREGASRGFWAGAQRVGALMALPERARAQGAPAHWLGHVGVEDVEAAARRFVALGAQPLGPVQQPSPGESMALLKDPQGAVVALCSGRVKANPEVIAWHELHTTDRERAWACYAELFGWQEAGAFELGVSVGTYQLFNWSDVGTPVGGMVNTARLLGVHTHWLFYLPVKDLDVTIPLLRQWGGTLVNGPMQVPSGDRVAQCEDPQGAAFALYQSASDAV